MKAARATQCGRILELLIASRGDWVPLPKIADCAAQYNARIYELRRLGFCIMNRTQRVNGSRHSWFRLEAGQLPTNPQQTTLTPAEARPFPEFGLLAPESYGVD